MDLFLGKVTQQAMNYAIRSGVTITAGYAMRQFPRLLKTVEGTEKDELQDLQDRLSNKIRIISPAIDMIELISARGNTSLESAVFLTKSLRWEIQSLGQRLAAAANAEELIQRKSLRAKDKQEYQRELKQIISAIRKLLTRIEDAVPLINLAITASGASLSSTLPSTVSPSRLLQASTFLTAGDSQYATNPSHVVQIGPTFTLSMYMLFLGHVRPQNEQDVRESTWKEVIHKANVRLLRVPIKAIYDLPGTQGLNPLDASRPGETGDGYFPTQIEGEGKADEYAYQLAIIEDLDDDRVHGDEEKSGVCDDVLSAGIRETLPIHELSKIFYADTGKILNIGSEGETNSPILLLKRDINAAPPRRMMERYSEDPSEPFADIADTDTPLPNGHDEGNSQLSLPSNDEGASQLAGSPHYHATATASPAQEQPPVVPDQWRLPPNLDPEWLAFEVYTESPDSDTETSPPSSPAAGASSRGPSLSNALSRLNIASPTPSIQPSSRPPSRQQTQQQQLSMPAITTSLSFLETILRLLALQQFQQAPHLSIPDELLTFFLSESASTGADGEERKRVRNEARRRVGFDPYDESPVKRRGEEYQYQRGEQSLDEYSNGGWEEDGRASPGANSRGGRYATPLRYDEGYETHSWERSSPRPSPASKAGSSPLLLKGRAQSERGGTPLRWQRSLTQDREIRQGSPLARPGTGVTDEGLGTSPGSGGEGEAQVGAPEKKDG